jgi:hypothetical protein
MDDIDVLVKQIIQRVYASNLPDTEKADIYVQVEVGMRKLVWPILLSHMPTYMLDEAVRHPEKMDMTKYTELIESALQNPATPKEIHDEIKGALEEIDALLDARLPTQKPHTP